MLLNSAPKGQKANSPGHRPGYKDVIRFALKGQKHLLCIQKLLPFQGVSCELHLPRALPWAVSLLAFQAVYTSLRNLKNIIYATMTHKLPQEQIYATPSHKFMTPGKDLLGKLSFSHIREIMTQDDPLARFFYETECIKGTCLRRAKFSQ